MSPLLILALPEKLATVKRAGGGKMTTYTILFMTRFSYKQLYSHKKIFCKEVGERDGFKMLNV